MRSPSYKNYETCTNYITYLSVFSCFAVVMLHCNNCFHTYENNPIWIFSNVLECIFYFAVPCFFMISGANLIDYNDKYDTKTYFKKRFFKTVLPFLFWSTCALIANIIKKIQSSQVITFKYIIEHYILGEDLNYWFFPVLFVLYLVFPLISFIKKENRLKICCYIFAILFVSNSLIPFIFTVSKSSISNPLHFSYLFGPLMYACLGYIIKNVSLSKKVVLILIVLGFSGFLTHLLGTQILTVKQGSLNSLFKGYYTPICLCYSLSIFVIFKEFVSKINNKAFVSISTFGAKYTFSIYLLHTMVLLFYTQYVFGKWWHVQSASYLFVFISPLLVIPTTIGIIRLIRFIPIARKLVP